MTGKMSKELKERIVGLLRLEGGVIDSLLRALARIGCRKRLQSQNFRFMMFLTSCAEVGGPKHRYVYSPVHSTAN